MTKPTSITQGAEFDLAVEEPELRLEDAYRLDGRTVRTLVREPMTRIVLNLVSSSVATDRTSLGLGVNRQDLRWIYAVPQPNRHAKRHA